MTGLIMAAGYLLYCIRVEASFLCSKVTSHCELDVLEAKIKIITDRFKRTMFPVTQPTPVLLNNPIVDGVFSIDDTSSFLKESPSRIADAPPDTVAIEATLDSVAGPVRSDGEVESLDPRVLPEPMQRKQDLLCGARDMLHMSIFEMVSRHIELFEALYTRDAECYTRRCLWRLVEQCETTHQVLSSCK